jgi:hypothetical protein
MTNENEIAIKVSSITSPLILPTTDDQAMAELDKVLEDAVADSYIPQLIKAEIVHVTASFNIEGMPSMTSLTGIIISAKRNRVFFPKYADKIFSDKLIKLSEGRPFCSSTDCVKGDIAEIDIENSGGEVRSSAEMIKAKLAQGGLICKLCPFSQFGSVKDFGLSGRGQACNELRRLLFWRPDVNIPMVISLPPTSIRAWDGYMSSLNIANKQANKVITELSLVPVETGSNKYATARLSYKADIDQGILQLMLKPTVIGGVQKSFIKAMIDLFLQKPIDVEDYMGTTNGHAESEDGF